VAKRTWDVPRTGRRRLRARLLVFWTSLHIPLGFPARGDREHMMLHGFAIPCRLHREHICEGLHDEPIGDEGGPWGLHAHLFWGGRPGEEGGERMACRGSGALVKIGVCWPLARSGGPHVALRERMARNAATCWASRHCCRGVRSGVASARERSRGAIRSACLSRTITSSTVVSRALSAELTRVLSSC
jgi:hypothetical protein